MATAENVALDHHDHKFILFCKSEVQQTASSHQLLNHPWEEFIINAFQKRLEMFVLFCVAPPQIPGSLILS